MGGRYAPPAAVLVSARLPPRDLLGEFGHDRPGRRDVSRRGSHPARAHRGARVARAHANDPSSRLPAARADVRALGPVLDLAVRLRAGRARRARRSRRPARESGHRARGRRRPGGTVAARDRVDARLQRHSASQCDDGRMRILVAEDETIIRLDLTELLVRAGFEVCAEARDGEEAVALARSEEPDLAIMDVKMPNVDGIEAARRILDERPIPIVMLTAYGQDELVSRAVEAGVFGYLVKPFREQDLLPAIAAARARHDELQAVREEAESLAEALASRKVIERAKGLLMEKEHLSEQDAFARLRKASQVSGRPLKVIAEAVVA